MNKIYFVLGLLLYITGYLFESYYLNLLGILFISCYSIFLLKYDKNFSAIALFFIWSYFITAVICCIAEFSGYFTEIREVSYLTGATLRNISLAFFTLYFSRISFSFCSRAIPEINIKISVANFVHKLIEVFYIIIIIILFFIWVKYGHPNDYGLDRFIYWSTIAPKWGEWLRYISVYFILYFGYMYAATKSKYYVLIVLIGNISYYLVGDKLSIFLTSFFYFIIPIILFSKKNIIEIFFTKKTLFILLCFILISFVSTYLSYFYIYGGDSTQALSKFGLRGLLQAQMWWKIDALALNKGIEDLDVIMTGFIGINVDATETGMYFFMKNIAPPDLYYMMVENGITFTMLYPANLNYFFSFPLALFMTIPIGFYAGFIFNMVYKLIKSRNLVLLICSAVLYQNIGSIILMGQTFHLFSSRNLLALAIIFFYLILSIGHYSRNYTK